MNKVVYIMSCNGYLKIGTAKDVPRRLKQTQVYTPHPVKLEAVWDTPFRPATEVEALAHRLLAKFRVRGEWFNATMDDVRDAEGRLFEFACNGHSVALSKYEGRSTRYAKEIMLQGRWLTLEEQAEFLRLDGLPLAS